jgi:hypothetical protein
MNPDWRRFSFPKKFMTRIRRKRNPDPQHYRTKGLSCSDILPYISPLLCEVRSYKKSAQISPKTIGIMIKVENSGSRVASKNRPARKASIFR